MTATATRRAVLGAGLAGAAGMAAPAALASGDQALNAVLEEAFDEELRLSPNLRSIRSIPGDQSRWTIPDAALATALAQTGERTLTKARAVRAVSDAGQLNIDLYAVEAKLAESRRRWRLQTYPFHMFGSPPAYVNFLLANYHQVTDLQGAEDYVARVRAAPALIASQAAQMRERFEAGCPPPAFNFPALVAEARGWSVGAPFDAGADHPILATFKTKTADAGLSGAGIAALERDLRQAMPALGREVARFADEIAALGVRAEVNNGVWALPDGAAFYRACIEEHTNLDLDPGDLHAFGHAELARTQDQMREIMREVRFDGDLAAFLVFLRDDPRFFQPADEAGRAKVLAGYRTAVAEMQERLGELFGVQPKAGVVVTPLPRETEASQGRAFYVESSPDGRRPGVFYINLGKPEANPTHQIQTVAYHEAIPGHHLQQAIAAEQTGLPRFRKYLAHNCFGEGWALYAEGLPAEIGLYRDPYARAGQLSMEMLRAVRVIADTGIHHKRWTLERTVAFMDAHLANSRVDNLVETRRYFVWPGQALGYQVGLDWIRKLRARATATLGRRFDRRRFHDAVLGAGSLPMLLLERRIDTFIASERTRSA